MELGRKRTNGVDVSDDDDVNVKLVLSHFSTVEVIARSASVAKSERRKPRQGRVGVEGLSQC